MLVARGPCANAARRHQRPHAAAQRPAERAALGLALWAMPVHTSIQLDATTASTTTGLRTWHDHESTRPLSAMSLDAGQVEEVKDYGS